MRHVRGAVLLLATVFLGGCLDYDEVLALKSDGSGTLRVDLTLDVAFVQKLRALDPEAASEDSGDLKDFVSKEAILKSCDAKDLKVTTCEVEEKGTKTRVKLECEFPSLDVLRSIQGFSDRKLELVASDDKVEVVYRFDARSMLTALGLASGDDPKPTTDLEKKMLAVVDEAREASSGRFVLKLPGKVVATTGKVTETDDHAVRWEIPRKDAKAHEAVLKGPLAMKASAARKDFAPALLESEKKKAAAPPAAPDRKPGD